MHKIYPRCGVRSTWLLWLRQIKAKHSATRMASPNRNADGSFGFFGFAKSNQSEAVWLLWHWRSQTAHRNAVWLRQCTAKRSTKQRGEQKNC